MGGGDLGPSTAAGASGWAEELVDESNCAYDHFYNGKFFSRDLHFLTSCEDVAHVEMLVQALSQLDMCSKTKIKSRFRVYMCLCNANIDMNILT